MLHHYGGTKGGKFQTASFAIAKYPVTNAQFQRFLDEPNGFATPVRLPTEQEWQRAALGDRNQQYPWGNQLEEEYGNFGNAVGHPTNVRSYPDGQSPCGAMDMLGNVWEWCLTTWGTDDGQDASGYTYRLLKGGAWNVSNPEHLRAIDRYGHPPRGRLNDAGFRCAYYY